MLFGNPVSRSTQSRFQIFMSISPFLMKPRRGSFAGLQVTRRAWGVPNSLGIAICYGRKSLATLKRTGAVILKVYVSCISSCTQLQCAGYNASERRAILKKDGVQADPHTSGAKADMLAAPPQPDFTESCRSRINCRRLARSQVRRHFRPSLKSRSARPHRA